MNKTSLLAFAALANATLLFAPALTLAQDSTSESKTVNKLGGSQAPETAKKDPKVEEYEKLVKDATKFSGAFTLYTRKRDILVEIPEDKIGKMFYVQNTLSTGFSQNMQAGDPVMTDSASFSSVQVYRIEKRDETMFLIRPNIRFRWDEKDPLALASKRSFPEAVLADYKIEGHNPETKRYLVNMTNFFNGEVSGINFFVMIFGAGQYMLDRDRTRVERVYSNNNMSVVRMDMHYQQPMSPASLLGGAEDGLAALFGAANQYEDARSIPMVVNTTLWYREPSKYVPRVSDPRVGYFTNDFYNVDKFFDRALDRKERYINRWNLVKKDPKAALSEPVKPIVWTIDHSIPEKWVPAVTAGVLRWNKAFEALGYKNAVQVVRAPKDDPNYDHADGTRNVIRFTMTPDAAYAVALFRTDPISGEILNAGVTIDANFTSFLNREYMVSAPVVAKVPEMLDFARLSLTRQAKPQGSPLQLLNGTAKYQDPRLKKLESMGWQNHQCSLQTQRLNDLALDVRAAVAAGMNMTGEDFIATALTDTVAHEIGHCMGLRHNFVASTTLSTEELGNPALVKKYGVASSVMDYTPTNALGFLKRDKSLLFNPEIGPYDVFAIEYGYKSTTASTPEGERFALGQIARKGGQKGLAFMTDEEADGVDPYVVRFDNGADPLNYIERDLQVRRQTRQWALANLPHPGQSYAERNIIVLRSLTAAYRQVANAARFVGGVSGSRNFKGDVNERPTLAAVDPKVQRQAMGIISKYGLSMGSLDLPDSVLRTLSSFDEDAAPGYDGSRLREVFMLSQVMVLAELMSSQKIDMIAENSFRAGKAKDAYSISEHYQRLYSSVFSELEGGHSVSGLRRDLQSFFVESLMAQSGAKFGQLNEDARISAMAMSKSLRSKLAAKAKASGKLDRATLAHFRALEDRLTRFHNRIQSGG